MSSTPRLQDDSGDEGPIRDDPGRYSRSLEVARFARNGPKSRQESWRSNGNRLLAMLVAASAAVFGWLFLRSEGWAGALSLSTPVAFAVVAVTDLILLWSSLYLLFRPRQTILPLPDRPAAPTSPEHYAECGLGPLLDSADPIDLYLDSMKRSLTNVLYEDVAYWFYDSEKRGVLGGVFDLERRLRGADSPTTALTMIGLERMNNIQLCVEDVLRRDVPGDLIETGSYRGGATIFMRAVLKAHGVRNRRVFVCDSFMSIRRPPLVFMPVLQALAAIPFMWWQRRMFIAIQVLAQRLSGFPVVKDPSDDMIRFTLWNLVNPVLLNNDEQVTLETAKSHFARCGLLDDQVVFLHGLFSDTLPTAPIERLAVVRLDGDTYESTRDGIEHLYPKLSIGGYLIVDDYGAFEVCQRAVDDYRAEFGIDDPIISIDDQGVYWQKT